MDGYVGGWCADDAVWCGLCSCAVKKFLELQHARDFLLDPKQKEKYDKELHQERLAKRKQQERDAALDNERRRMRDGAFVRDEEWRSRYECYVGLLRVTDNRVVQPTRRPRAERTESRPQAQAGGRKWWVQQERLEQAAREWTREAEGDGRAARTRCTATRRGGGVRCVCVWSTRLRTLSTCGPSALTVRLVVLTGAGSKSQRTVTVKWDRKQHSHSDDTLSHAFRKYGEIEAIRIKTSAARVVFTTASAAVRVVFGMGLLRWPGEVVFADEQWLCGIPSLRYTGAMCADRSAQALLARGVDPRPHCRGGRRAHGADDVAHKCAERIRDDDDC